jgi:hypothetical protein
METAWLIVVLGLGSLLPYSHGQEAVPLRIERAGFTADGAFQMQVTGPPNTSFLLESSSDCDYFDALSEPSPVGPGMLVRFYWCDDKGNCVVTDSYPHAPARFYRLHVFVMPN